MEKWLLIIMLLPLFCESASLSVICIPPPGAVHNSHQISKKSNNDVGVAKILIDDDDDFDGENDNSLTNRVNDTRKSIKISRQRTYIRNPNYISANKKFDEMAKTMYITELPLPHPGAQPGSTNGCEKIKGFP